MTITSHRIVEFVLTAGARVALLLLATFATTFATTTFAAASAAGPINATLNATISAIGDEYKNIDLTATTADFTAAGISEGRRIMFEHNGQRLPATFARAYSDVDEGQWIILPNDDGTLRLAISFGHACTELQCQLGDKVLLITGE